MKGFIKQTAAGICFSAALFTVLGCAHYRDLVDPCWPQRYNSIARQNVRDMHDAQAAQGHKLDTTLWNTYFDTDTKSGDGNAVLNEAGKEFLRNIARRQPFPDGQLWLAYPHDVRDAGRRDGIIAARKLAIRDFLTTHTKLGGGANFQIDVHDLAQPSYPAAWTDRAYNAIDIQGKLVVAPSSGSSSSK